MHVSTHADEAPLCRFFEALHEGFKQMAARRGEAVHELCIAGRHVRLRVAGSRLASLVRPLAHLVQNTSANVGRPATLEILAWDGPADWHPPRPPWDFHQLSWLGEVTAAEGSAFAINFSPDHGLLQILHRPTGRVLYWLPSADALPFWEVAAPFRVPLHWWAQSFGGHVAHAAAVGHDGRGVLMVGRGGSGKSSTSIGCVDAGFEFVGDDYVLLTPGPQPTAHSLYHTAKMHTEFMHRRMPHWAGQVALEIGPERKSVFFLNECRSRQVQRQLAIDAIIQPRISPTARTGMENLPRSLALLGLAPSTMYQLPGARQATLSFFAAWARELPAYTLHLGGSPTDAAQEISRLVTRQEVPCAA
ncbi:MAG: hypothetical protein K8T25_19875 [Planctomycetia bacterium]|nr:hypothetical protein [Planctomycetia bacterium]